MDPWTTYIPFFESSQDQDQPRTEALSARAMNHRVLRAAFFDLLGRPPFRDEYERWLNKSLADLLDAVLGNQEYWNQWWEEQLYYFLLIDQFRPATELAVEVPNKLTEGRLSVRDAVHRLALTSSFDLRNPGADTFVTVVMEQICGKTVQKDTRTLELGKNAYDGNPSRFMGTVASNQSDVIRICVEDKSAALHLISREYARLFRKDGERKRSVRACVGVDATVRSVGDIARPDGA